MPDLDNVPVDVIKGVGPARKRLLGKLGINTIADALRYYPRDYSDRCLVTRLADAGVGSSVLVVGKVTSVSLRRYSWRNSLLSVKVADGTGILSALWFNQAYLRSRFAKGQRLALFGKVGAGASGERQMTNPEVEMLPLGEEATPHLFRIVPIYPTTEELSQNIIRSVMHRAVGGYGERAREFMPFAVRERMRLISLREAVRNIHFPESWSALENAKRRLMFQEFFILQMGSAVKRKFLDEARKERPGASSRGRSAAEHFLRGLPFRLTGAQMRCIEEIRGDLLSPRAMNRLLHGDVGCGKTIVAVWAILHSIVGGCQVCLMAPTELLARQHFTEICNLLSDKECRVSLLVGAAVCKEEVYDEIADGRTELVVGTHALIEQKVRFKRLGLVVIDEQQRFGVLQRLKLYEKGDFPDVLVLSATPIPRTLCQTLYGDMDVSVIDEMPPGRLPVRTRWLPSCQVDRAYGLVRKVVGSGGRAYIVCPTIEEKEASERMSVVETHRQLASEVFPEMRVGLLHGSMEPTEREEVIGKFRNGVLDIVVTTTVIEVGIDIPDAGAMLIMNGECFGLAQLHQMRGRVGRGKEQGYCIVVADPRTDAARQRLEIFEQTRDGFKIAAEDLKLRGVGEFFGTRQHGLPEVARGNILEDYEMMRLAREEAFSVANGKVPLRQGEGEALAEELRRSYGERLHFSFV